MVTISVKYFFWHHNDLVDETIQLYVSDDYASKLIELVPFLNGGDYEVKNIPKHRELFIHLLEYISLIYYFIDDCCFGFCIYDITSD